VPTTTALTETESEIRDLLRQWRAVMASSRPRWGATDLTFTQLRALSVIARRGSVRVSELAEELGVGLAAASALADRMAGRQLITRRPDPDDRRITRLEAAKRGQHLLERLERGSTEHLGKLIERMSPAEREALATTLRAFVRLSAEHSLRKGPEGLLIVQRDAKC
jgi:DNA-binding MarR family transcriptional regulator